MTTDERDTAYKAFENVNSDLSQKRVITSLREKVPYLITKLVELPVHEKYGLSWRIHLRDSDKKHFFIILTSRIVEKVGSRNMSVYQQDVEAKRPPFFMYLGMDGSAFNVIIKPFDLSIARAALKGQVFEFEQKAKREDSFDWLDQAVDEAEEPSAKKTKT